MPHIVTEPCYGCKHTLCVTVCPCDCFHEGAEMLFIDPDKCTDCCACAAECPTHAIFADHEVPEPWYDYIHLNAEMAAVSPSITERKKPVRQ